MIHLHWIDLTLYGGCIVVSMVLFGYLLRMCGEERRVRRVQAVWNRDWRGWLEARQRQGGALDGSLHRMRWLSRGEDVDDDG